MGWKRREEERKIAWIGWNSVSKEKGGLGIKNLVVFNDALVGKWGWNLLKEKSRGWVRELKAKYGDLNTYIPS